jgi:hypothetical protein
MLFFQQTDSDEQFWLDCEEFNENQTEPTFEGSVHLVKNCQTEIHARSGYLYLIGGVLNFSNSECDPLIRSIAIVRNCYVEVIGNMVIITKSERVQTLLEFESGEVAQKWKSVLAKCCIFRELDFKIHKRKLLGAGGTAEVYLTSDGCAAKVISKDHL